MRLSCPRTSERLQLEPPRAATETWSRRCARWRTTALSLLLTGCISGHPGETEPGSSTRSNTDAGAPTSAIVEVESPNQPGAVEVPELHPVAAPQELDCSGVHPVATEGRLLTGRQYNNTVRDLFRGKVAADFSANFPAENSVLGFRTSAKYHRINSTLAAAHLTAAEAVGEQVRQHAGELLACADTAQPGRDCAAAFIDEYGARAFRRPLRKGEGEALLELYQRNSREEFGVALALLVEALLQAPQFLYRFERQRASGGPSYGPFELASRLSYLLWNTMPDDVLLLAAESGELTTRQQVREQALRMLDMEGATDVIEDFHEQWMGLGSLPAAVRDAQDAPRNADGRRGTTDGFGELWKQSVLKFVQHSATSSGTLEDLFTSRVVFLHEAQAAWYGLLSVGVGEDGWIKTSIDGEGRAGLLTQPGLLAHLAHPDQSAPVQRGVFVRERILCQPPAPPPEDADIKPPDPDPTLTTRQRFAQHTEAPQCSGCHLQFDPIGLAFEGFDHLGRHRTHENGIAVDVSGEIIAPREAEIAGPFEGPAELALRLQGSAQVRDCVAAQWYRYGMGRVEAREDWCSLASIQAEFADSGGDLRQLLLAIVGSDAFLLRPESDREGVGP